MFLRLPKAKLTAIFEIMQKIQKIEISLKTIVFTVAFLISLRLLWQVRELLFSLFIAFMVMSVVRPMVLKLGKYKIRPVLAAFLIFSLLIFFIVFGISWIFPPLVEDMTALFNRLQDMVYSIDPNIVKQLNIDYLFGATNKLFPFLRDIFSSIVFVVTTIFFSFYFVLEGDVVKNFPRKFLSNDRAEKFVQIFEKTEKRMGTWFRAEIILMIIIGVTTYIGLSLIGIRHALSLAVIAGLLEAVPSIGPVIAAIPAFIFAVNQSYFLGLSTLALYVVIQQLENNLVVPYIMKRAVGLNKILILIVLIMGGKTAGILGLFTAIPLTLAVETILSELKKS